MALMNVRIIRFDKEKIFNPEREFVKSKEKVTYKFYCQILQGFEIASNIDPEKLETSVAISIGALTVE